MIDSSDKYFADPQEGEVGLVEYQDFICDEEFTFVSGETLPSFTLRYETYGSLNKEASNAILICHALSGDHHAAGIHTLDDRKPGWWNSMIGPGKPIDTNRFFVICSNCIGGCQGSTGPSSINPDTGKPYGLRFPKLSIEDMVRAQEKLISSLGISSLYAAIGGSMGGMQVLQWSITFPDKVQRVIAMATTARQNAQTIAFNEVGRAAICQDPKWRNGDYPADDGPDTGLSIARMMAHITYLSDSSMDQKFGRLRRNNVTKKELTDVDFEVESYLRYQGRSFVNRFDANTYLYFTKALDEFDLYGDESTMIDSFSPVKAKVLVIGFTSDWLYPPQQNRDIVLSLIRGAKNASYGEVTSALGHDSFLLKDPLFFSLVSEFLKPTQ